MLTFNIKYLLLAFCIFILEIFIEQSSGFIRYVMGDFFAVIFVYAIFKTFLKISVLTSGIMALAIAFGIEFLQLTNLQHYYPSEYKKLFGLLLGSSFSVEDLLAYTLGVVLTILIEYKIYVYRFNLKHSKN